MKYLFKIKSIDIQKYNMEIKGWALPILFPDEAEKLI